MVIILVICMIGLLVGSVFGIFFSGEDSGNGYTMPMAIQELNTKYADKVSEIRNNNAHDEVVMSGSRAEWKEVLAVYAVKVNTDSDNPAEVATLDDDKAERLRGVLNDMTSLSYSFKTETHEQTVTDEEGNETTETVEIITLVITLTQKSADEMAAHLDFNSKIASANAIMGVYPI